MIDARTVDARAAHLPEGAPGFDVFLVIGGAEACATSRAGGGAFSDDPDNARVLVWSHAYNRPASRQYRWSPVCADAVGVYGDGWNAFQGPGTLAHNFASAYADTLPPHRRALVVPCASAWAAPLADGYTPTICAGLDSPPVTSLTFRPDAAGYSLLDLAIRQANRAMAYHPATAPLPEPGTPPSPFNAFKGVLVLAASDTVGRGYAEADARRCLRGVVERVRGEVAGAADAPFVFGEALASAPSPEADGVARVLARAHELAPLCAAASTTAPTRIQDDGVLFTPRGAVAYGKRMFETYQTLAARAVPSVTNARAVLGDDGVANVTWWPSEDTRTTELRVGAADPFLLANAAVRLANAPLRTPIVLTPRSAKGVVGEAVEVRVVDTPWYERLFAAH